jgi:hypothetical protein
VSILVSLARMHSDMSTGFAASLSASIRAQLTKLPPRSIVNAIWAFGRCRHAPQPLLDALVATLSTYEDRAAWHRMSDDERAGAVVVMTGTPWALAAGPWPRAASKKAAHMALNLLHMHGAIAHLSSASHLTSMLWGIAQLRPYVPIELLRSAFQEVDSLDPHELTTVDCVNVLYAAAVCKQHNHALLRRCADALAGRAVQRLSAVRVAEVAFAVGTLELYHGCAALSPPALFTRHAS